MTGRLATRLVGGLLAGLPPLLLSAVVLTVATAQTGPPDEPPAATPVRAIVLVDESGSLTEADVERERQAVALLVQSDLSTASEFAIYGFGSSNAPGQNAVQPYCELTTVDSVGARQALASCANLVHRRSGQEGPDTDHASAIRAAVEKLAEPGKGRGGVVFLLTDGVLDVANSPAYGADSRQRGAEADRQLDTEILPKARSNDVQIWPLGFGDADPAALARFAAGGSGANPRCSGRSAVPEARVVGDVGEVAFALLSALSSARCSVFEQPTRGVVRNEPLDLKVRIPLIATDGSIAVTKVDTRIQVTYYDPDGKEVPATGEIDRQAFERSGAQGPVEALRITNPKPGEWTVRLRAPDGFEQQPVAAVAIWQGAVRSVVTVSPVVVPPGQEGQVRVRLQTRAGVITDPSALRDLRFEATVAGAGFQDMRVGLSDSGAKPDAKAADGEYTGGFVLPGAATGEVSVCGAVDGPGIAGDQRCAYFDVAVVGRVARADVDPRAPARVHRGDALTGTMTFTSPVPPFAARVSVDQMTSGTDIQVEPAVMQVATGQGPQDFRLVVGKRAELGQLSGRIEVRDSEDRVIGQAFFLTEVTLPPGWWQRNWLAVLLGAVLALAVLVVARSVLARRERVRRVGGLVATLQGAEGPMGFAVPAPGGRAKEFGLRLDSGGRSIEMCNPTAEGAIVVRRGAHGQVVMTGPGQPAVTCPSLDVGGGLSIRVDDRRAGRPARQPTQPQPRPETPEPGVSVLHADDLL